LNQNINRRNNHYDIKYNSAILPSSKKISVYDFKIIKIKGEGKFGKVFCVRHIETSTIYALKKISK
jgi:serine/threonine protein kinase